VAGGDFVRIRRVGFRDGTDDDLRALHAVEVPIEMERGSNRMPRALGPYMAFARNLPAQWHDHAWMAESADGEPVGVGYCWYHADGDGRSMTCDVLVREDRRRQGIGAALMARVCDQALADGRPLLTWATWDAVPAAAAFSDRVGGAVGRVSRESELRLARVDWPMIERWASGQPGRADGYALEAVDGPFPERLRGDAVTFHHIMQTAPSDGLQASEVFIDAAFVAELDSALRDSGRTRWTLLVRAPDGTCVGGTEVVFEAEDPETAFQQNTGIDPAHRGRGLAKWAKGVMLLRIRRERPSVRVVRTGNAFSNAPMLAINDAMGFEVVSTRIDWQADADAVRQALGAPDLG